MNFILSHKVKIVYFMKDMDKVRAISEMEVNLSQDDDQKELHYWKKAALESAFVRK